MRSTSARRKLTSPAVRSTIHLLARLFARALGRPARKRGVHRHSVEASHHDVFDLRRIWRVVALSRKARADVAAAFVARTDAMALIVLDVEVAHFMDRLKQAQNGLIFPLPSILRNDAREFPATNSSAAKGMTPGKASGLAQQRRKRRHGASRGRAVPVWRCYTEFDSKGDCP